MCHLFQKEVTTQQRYTTTTRHDTTRRSSLNNKKIMITTGGSYRQRHAGNQAVIASHHNDNTTTTLFNVLCCFCIVVVVVVVVVVDDDICTKTSQSTPWQCDRFSRKRRESSQWKLLSGAKNLHPNLYSAEPIQAVLQCMMCLTASWAGELFDSSSRCLYAWNIMLWPDLSWANRVPYFLLVTSCLTFCIFDTKDMIFTRATLCVSAVFAVEIWLAGWLSVSLSHAGFVSNG